MPTLGGELAGAPADDGAGVPRALEGLPELLVLLADGGALRHEVSAPAYIDACQGLMMRVALEETDLELRRTTVDEERRARADRQLARWSPRSRRYSAVTVLSRRRLAPLGQCGSGGGLAQALGAGLSGQPWHGRGGGGFLLGQRGGGHALVIR